MAVVDQYGHSPQASWSAFTAALRLVQGMTVQAYGVIASGTRCQSWQADLIRFTVTVPVSGQAGQLIAAQLGEIGATDVTLSPFLGSIAGQRAILATARED